MENNYYILNHIKQSLKVHFKKYPISSFPIGISNKILKRFTCMISNEAHQQFISYTSSHHYKKITFLKYVFSSLILILKRQKQFLHLTKIKNNSIYPQTR